MERLLITAETESITALFLSPVLTAVRSAITIMEEQRKKVENCVVDIISTLREAKITVEEFRGDESQATLFRLLYVGPFSINY